LQGRSGRFDVQDYRNLRVWQKAHKLALATYSISACLQKPEAWPLRDQALRAAISIPSNIAEGAGRGSDPDFRRFLWHSLGSCNELEYDLLLALDLRFLSSEQHASLRQQVEDVRRMLSGLVEALTPSDASR
jgi:four helix bundle protein